MRRDDVREHVLQVLIVNKKTRSIALSGLFSALCISSLFVSSVWPTGQLGTVAFSSLFVAAAVIELGVFHGTSVFAISSALGMLMLPNKSVLIIFIAFFGYYPILKIIIEKKLPVPVQWVLKVAVFDCSFSVIWFLLRRFLPSFADNYLRINIFVIYLCVNAVFVLFDYGYSKLLTLYKSRISTSGR